MTIKHTMEHQGGTKAACPLVHEAFGNSLQAQTSIDDVRKIAAPNKEILLVRIGLQRGDLEAGGLQGIIEYDVVVLTEHVWVVTGVTLLLRVSRLSDEVGIPL
jgi:hypothetical protein